MTKINTLAHAIPLLLAGLSVTGVSQAASVTVPTASANAKLTLNNVDGSFSAVLDALDNSPLRGGQVFRVTLGAVNGASVDASLVNGQVVVANISQDAITSHNATLILTKATVPYEVTVTNLTTTSVSNGATTQVIFNQGPKGDNGPAGATGPKGDTGPIGLKGDNGPAGAKGDAGPAGAKGDAGLAGAKGDAGPAGAKGDTGPIGLTGLKGDTGPSGPVGPAGPTGPQGPTLTGSGTNALQYWNGTAWVALSAGANGSTLTVVNGVPAWQ